MNTGGASQLGNTHDCLFNIARGDHHQISELVHNHQQVRVLVDGTFTAGLRLHLALTHRLIEIIHMFKPVMRQVIVAGVHLTNHPLQGLSSLLWVRNNGGNQVRDTLIGGQLHTFRIHHHQAHLVRGGTHQNRGDH